MAAVPALVVVAVFGYGYWHTVSHAVLHNIELRDSSGTDVRQPDAELTFLDRTGRVLAQYATDDQHSIFHVSNPATYVCWEIEKRAFFEVGGHEAYRKCFHRQARWIATWVRDVSNVDVRVGECEWHRVPVALTEDPSGPADWWLFWPTPHAGGEPYTLFQARVTVDTDRCRRDS